MAKTAYRFMTFSAKLFKTLWDGCFLYTYSNVSDLVVQWYTAETMALWLNMSESQRLTLISRLETPTIDEENPDLAYLPVLG